MASGSITVGSLVLLQESLSLNDLVDVDSETPSSGETIVYKDNAVDTGFTTGWHSTQLTTDDISGVTTTNATQNDLLAFNDNAIDPTFVDGFVPKNVGSVFTDLESTVNSIVGINTAIIRAETGEPAKTDMVMFTAVPSGGGFTCSFGSNGPNNRISKKEPQEGSFSFIKVLNAGQTDNITFPAGTVLRSNKGIYGFSGPLPTPLGPLSFALTQCQFYVSGTATLNYVSLGTEVTVSLLSADRSVVLSGPTIVPSYQVSSFPCPSEGEYFVSSSGPICASVNENNTNIRVLAPMVTELMVRNVGCLVSALETTTNVTWFRRNGLTGTLTVNPGTAVALGAGTNATGTNGTVRVVSDKPIGTWSSTDGTGNQAISGFPLGQTAQRFCNPLFVDSTNTASRTNVLISSLYEGTATVYDNTGTVLDTFTYTRSIPVTTAADQQYPAAGNWRPSLVSATTTWEGGYIDTNTPATCLMNFNGDSVWGSSGEEMMIVGSTPDDIRADIKRDGNGIWRRRDISATGVVTWNIC